MTYSGPVSVHGGHSGQFCSHARDTLEAIIQAYCRQGYAWVGITEHMPPASKEFVYPEEKRDGWDVVSLMDRFADYMATCRELQKRYADRIRILAGFETEYTRGSLDLAKKLMDRFVPDYIVGSVHHVQDIPFDYDRASYLRATERCGGLNELYISYFDQQYEMIQTLHPQVVGHMDIIRMHDPAYPARLLEPAIWRRIVRNLEAIKSLDLILDFNLRPLSKGEKDPYLSGPILDKAVKLNIDIVPGDDSHGVRDIGSHMSAAIEKLCAAGVRPPWRMPVEN
ncbi:MAG: hypothetical protein CR984_01585 [Proteobacteria bacterium]|nr:MAG: hypothetical protein CR984_01585 [Pseudomonadota bacterium]PIE67093.1 MAG: hypothetical protein CSA23_05865 [Deltaproteobacteria bacterium]